MGERENLFYATGTFREQITSLLDHPLSPNPLGQIDAMSLSSDWLVAATYSAPPSD